MARTTEEINEEIIQAAQASGDLQDKLTSTSATAIWRLWAFITAFVFSTIEKLFDSLREEINRLILLQKPHTLRWYVTKALAFQYGFQLLPDSDLFDNTEKTTEEIEDSKVVAYAAANEVVTSSGRHSLRLKVAKNSGNDLEPLSEQELNSFKEYISRIKDAGVVINSTSQEPDSLRQQWRIFYDPLVLTSEGHRVDGSATDVVKNEIQRYLTQLPFNGTFVNAYHENAIQAIPGVVNALLDQSEARYGARPFQQVLVEYNPDAGYLRFDSEEDLIIQFIPRSAIL